MQDKKTCPPKLNAKAIQRRRIKILRIIARLNVGGPALHSILLTNALNTDGFESILVSGVVEKGEREMDFLLDKYKVKPIFIPELRREISIISDVVSFHKIRNLIRQYRPDIVHTHTSKAGFVGRLAAQFSGIPVKKVHTFHGHTFYGYFSKLKSRIFLNIERLLAKITDRIIAISPLQADDIVKKYKVTNRTKCMIIELGIDIGEFLRIDPRLKKKESIGFKKEDIIVGTVGRITDVKNHRLFVEVARAVYNYHRDNSEIADRLKFVIVGDGELREKVEKSIIELGLGDKVKITGWQKDVVKFYSAFDIFLLTSKNEGTPVSIIEAMASGLPVVSTPVGGVPDLLNVGTREYLKRDYNKESLVKDLNRLILNEDLRISCGESLRKRTEHSFHSDRLITNIRTLYEQLLKKE